MFIGKYSREPKNLQLLENRLTNEELNVEVVPYKKGLKLHVEGERLKVVLGSQYADIKGKAIGEKDRALLNIINEEYPRSYGRQVLKATIFMIACSSAAGIAVGQIKDPQTLRYCSYIGVGAIGASFLYAVHLFIPIKHHFLRKT